MKRNLVAALLVFFAGHAWAADMPMPAPAPPPLYLPEARVYNWTGFYVGINGGGAFGLSNWTSPPPATGNFTVSGGLVGGTVGANYQLGQRRVWR